MAAAALGARICRQISPQTCSGPSKSLMPRVHFPRSVHGNGSKATGVLYVKGRAYSMVPEEKLFFRPVRPEVDEAAPKDDPIPRAASRAEDAARLCASLLDPYEDAKSIVHRVCREYGVMDLSEKQEFQTQLATELGAHLTQENIESLWNVLSTKGGDMPPPLALHHLMLAATPRYSALLHIFALHGKIGFLLDFRAELLAHIKKATGLETVSYLKVLDESLKFFFVQWFHPSLLELHRITFSNTSGQLLEKVVGYEAVHKITSLDKLKQRIGAGRRCLVFCHPSLPSEPLAILHIALMPEVAGGMEDINKRATEDIPPKAAIFYSISSTQPGLRGIDMGNVLIKAAVPLLQTEFQSLETFVTLSPIPAFRSWVLDSDIDEKVVFDKDCIVQQEEATNLHYHWRGWLQNGDKFCPGEDKANWGRHSHAPPGSSIEALDRRGSMDPFGTIRDIIRDEQWHENELLTGPLKPFLMRLGAHYLAVKKTKSGTIPCSVGNFHSRNGAEIHQLNWLADLSDNGLKQSCGIMVNYLYDIPRVGQNRREYLEQQMAHPSQKVLDLLL